MRGQRPFFLLAFLILTFTIFFRLFNFENRVHLQADNSQDVQIARYAYDNLLLPLAGPFSSAGPFHYGPWYFWFLEIASIFPFGFLTHWYLISFIHIILVGLIYFLGKEVGGKLTGIIASLFAAISPVQIDSSLTVWNPSVVPIISLLSLMFLIRFYKKKDIRDLFILNFLIGLGITIHFQLLLIFPAAIVSLILIKPSLKNFAKYFPFAISGLLLPFLPLLYLDSNLNWYNFKSLFIYLAVDQFNTWVPNRWITYAFDYWPNAWSYIVGGNKYITFILIFLVGLFSAIKLRGLKYNKVYYLVTFTFLIEFIAYRYYRGQRFQYYSFFAHPYILVLSAWAIHRFIVFRKLLGLVFLSLILFYTLNVSFENLKERGVRLNDFKKVKDELYARYPGTKFNIYGCFSNPNATSHPLALLLYYEGRDNGDGIKIGLCEDKEDVTWEPIVSLTNSLGKTLWYERSTYKVYYDTSEWWVKSPPGTGGNFWQYLKKNLSPKCYPHC